MKQNADGAWANDVCGSSQGVCCIHEVVWGMSNDITSSHERDQVGIHEAMEQQAITKAGVMATSTSLKVRTHGATRQQHLNMVVPIMARFLSSSKENVQRYLLFAHQFTPIYKVYGIPPPHPQISDMSGWYLVDQYRQLRQRDCGGEPCLL